MMYTKVRQLTKSIVDTMEPGTKFTTKELENLVYETYQGSDIDEECNTVPQSKLRHGVRWGQQTLKLNGVVSRLNGRGNWIKN